MAGTDRSVSVLIADDHALFRRGVQRLLAARGIAVVGQAEDGEHAVALTERRRPDVVLMDLHMPRRSGASATRMVRALPNPPAVVVLTASADEDDVLEAIGAGACGYLLKDARADEIATGVLLASSGISLLSPAIASQVVGHVRRGGRPQTSSPDAQLSARECEVLRLLADGRDNATIGSLLHISPATVKHHVANVLTKLGLRNRTQAAVYAARTGMV